MPLKNTLEKWDQAVKAFSEGQYEDCLRIYESTDEISARMYYNMACAYIKLHQESQAIQVSGPSYITTYSTDVTPFSILDTGKQVLWQTVKTQIRVCTV